MNNAVFILSILLSLCTLNSGWAQNVQHSDVNGYTSIGNGFLFENILNSHQMQQEYNNLKIGDTLKIKFASKVSAVCQNKGCWMKVSLEDGSEVMVKFKDYSFFVPKDIDNQIVIVNGLAYVQEMTVDELKHYAKDAGKSTEDIDAIVEPQRTLSFIADGVKIKK